MRTRSSPTQSEEDGEVTGNQVVSEPASVTSTRCHWSKDDDINLITYLIEHKSEEGEHSEQQLGGLSLNTLKRLAQRVVQSTTRHALINGQGYVKHFNNDGTC